MSFRIAPALRIGIGQRLFSKQFKNKHPPVSLQFSVAVMRYGFSGTGASGLNISMLASCSTGSVENWYNSVTHAIVHMAEDEIHWPSKSERQALCQHASEHGLREDFFDVDGTVIPLFEKPSIDNDSFSDRKSNYSLHALSVRLEPNYREHCCRVSWKCS